MLAAKVRRRRRRRRRRRLTLAWRGSAECNLWLSGDVVAALDKWCAAVTTTTTTAAAAADARDR